MINHPFLDLRLFGGWKKSPKIFLPNGGNFHGDESPKLESFKKNHQQKTTQEALINNVEDFEKTIPLRAPAGFESKKPNYPKHPGFDPGNPNSFAASKPWVCLRLKATRNDAQQKIYSVQKSFKILQ